MTAAPRNLTECGLVGGAVPNPAVPDGLLIWRLGSSSGQVLLVVGWCDWWWFLKSYGYSWSGSGTLNPVALDDLLVWRFVLSGG